MKKNLYKHIFAGLLLFSAGSGLRAQVPVLEFYKDGQVIYTEASQGGTTAERPVGNFEVLSAAEHPVKNHIQVDEISVMPNDAATWRLKYTLSTDLKHGNRRFWAKVSPALHASLYLHFDYDEYVYSSRYETDSLVINVRENELEINRWLDVLEKQTEYTFTFYEEAYGQTFKTDEVKIKTGYSEVDACHDYRASLSISSDGTRFVLPFDAVNLFLHKHHLGELTTYLYPHIFECMREYTSSDIQKISTPVSVYEGTLYVVNEIPDAVATYIAGLLGKKNVIPGGEGEVLRDYNNQPSMNVTEITNGVTGDTYWEIMAKSGTDHTDVTYTTAEQLAGKYVNLYVTMASGRGRNQSVEESLPVSFTAECNMVDSIGKWQKAGLDSEGNPDKKNSYLCNQFPELNYEVKDLQSQSNFQRCYVVKNDGGRKVYLGTVKVGEVGPIQLHFKSFGPTSTKTREVVYTRTLRIANVITEPFDTEEAAKAAIDKGDNVYAQTKDGSSVVVKGATIAAALDAYEKLHGQELSKAVVGFVGEAVAEKNAKELPLVGLAHGVPADYEMTSLPGEILDAAVQHLVNTSIQGTWALQGTTLPLVFRPDMTTNYNGGDCTYAYEPLTGKLTISGAENCVLDVIAIGKALSLQDENGLVKTYNYVMAQDPGYMGWVDLGLKSGTLWGVANVCCGSNNSWFAWGETNGAQLNIKDLPVLRDYTAMFPDKPVFDTYTYIQLQDKHKPSTWDKYGERKDVTFEEYWECPDNKQLKESRAQSNYERYLAKDSVGMWISYQAGLKDLEDRMTAYSADTAAIMNQYRTYMDDCLRANDEMYAQYAKTWQTYGYKGTAKELSASDDAASVNVTSAWQIPSVEQFQELIECCEWKPTYGYSNSDPDNPIITGYDVCGPNGRSIYLPAARVTAAKDSPAFHAKAYWTRNASGDDKHARALSFDGEDVKIVDLERIIGTNIRPVLRR